MFFIVYECVYMCVRLKSWEWAWGQGYVCVYVCVCVCGWYDCVSVFCFERGRGESKEGERGG